MKHGPLNPRQSDFAGHYRLAGGALAVGLVALFLGFSVGDGFLQTILVSAGVGLLIGSGAVVIATNRRRRRTRLMRDR